MDVNVKLNLEGKAFEASSAILQAFEFKENLKLQQFMKLACILCTCTLAIFSQLRGKVSLILSKSKKHEVGMTEITLEIIDDIHCHDTNNPKGNRSAAPA
ncbi:hypothetical protein F2Q70_00000208 [Brassica cretica]|uniref:Uncharacterized protein n=1 Tax=Brassica cretica TaxID=69181 RepID=A0A8S9IPK6_BRACR|nr:hypothetical protein F2Q70_00000208 [Brassica cretica]